MNFPLKIEYTAPKSLVKDGDPIVVEPDEYGNYMAESFDNYDDDDIVMFIYDITGDTTGVVNWGCGSIKDKGRTSTGFTVSVKELGENVHSMPLADLRELLDIEDPKWGGKALVFDVYDQGPAIVTKVGIKVQKMKEE